MSSIAAKRFFEEMASMLDKPVMVLTTDGKSYVGNLAGFDPGSISVCLIDAKDGEGREYPKVFIHGNVVSELMALERPFDLRGLAERLEKVFPRMVKLHEDIGVIVVMDKVRVTKDGVVEGSGPAAERARKVYEEFVRESLKGW